MDSLSDERKKQIEDEERYKLTVKEQVEKERKAKKEHRRNIGCLILLAIIFLPGIILSLGKPSNNTSNNEIPAPTKKISYEVVQTWVIPNGGYGKLIVISKSDATAENFAVLAQQLKQEYSKDRNASISVFIDRRAAEIRNQVLHNTSEGITNSDTTFYENNYVAQYDKNGNTGYHKFQYWPNGLYNDWISIDL